MLSRDTIKKLMQEEVTKSEPGLSPQDIENFAEKYKGSDRIVRFSDIEVTPQKPSSTGFKGVDDIIGGFYQEQVVTITAFPAHGKTTFTLDLARNIGAEKCLFLSLEQNPEDLKRQWVEQGLEIPNVYTPYDTDEALTHTEWIEWKIIEAQYHSGKEHGEPVRGVFIDHFGYIDWRREHGETHADAIRRVMHELKRIARRTDTFIVVIVHVNKEDETNPPLKKDLQGSSGYDQASDTILSLWRETYNEGKEQVQTSNVLLQVLKNRRFGDRGSAKYIFRNGKFHESNWISHEMETQKIKQQVEEEYKKGF